MCILIKSGSKIGVKTRSLLADSVDIKSVRSTSVNRRTKSKGGANGRVRRRTSVYKISMYELWADLLLVSVGVARTHRWNEYVYQPILWMGVCQDDTGGRN